MQVFTAPVCVPAAGPAAGHWGWRFQDGELGGSQTLLEDIRAHPAAKETPENKK